MHSLDALDHSFNLIFQVFVLKSFLKGHRFSRPKRRSYDVFGNESVKCVNRASYVHCPMKLDFLLLFMSCEEFVISNNVSTSTSGSYWDAHSVSYIISTLQVLERNFKSDFKDREGVYDILNRAYRRRPR